MKRAALISDTTCDLPLELAAELGVRLVPAGVAFSDHRYRDGEIASEDFYKRLAAADEAPLLSGPPQEDFDCAFEEALAEAERLLCLVTPFGVTPTYTNANAAATIMGETGKRIKIANAGVGSAGLCSLLVLLAELQAEHDLDVEALTAALELVAPQSDTIAFCPDLDWLERVGKLARIEERTGAIDDGVPLVRISTRVTGIEVCGSTDEAIGAAIKRASARLQGSESPVIATIAHAAAPDAAGALRTKLERDRACERVIVADLGPTIGSQLGPGAVALGIAPGKDGYPYA